MSIYLDIRHGKHYAQSCGNFTIDRVKDTPQIFLLKLVFHPTSHSIRERSNFIHARALK